MKELWALRCAVLFLTEFTDSTEGFSLISADGSLISTEHCSTPIPALRPMLKAVLICNSVSYALP
jgi:hypothetical protein